MTQKQALEKFGLTMVSSENYDKYYRLNGQQNRVDLLNDKKVAKLNGKTYDLLVMANQLAPLREEKDYWDHHGTIIEITMSCDKQEAIGWMETFITEALAATTGKVDIQLRCKFLAAFDIRKSLLSGR